MLTDAGGILLTSRVGRVMGRLAATGPLYSILEDATPIALQHAPETLVTMTQRWN